MGVISLGSLEIVLLLTEAAASSCVPPLEKHPRHLSKPKSVATIFSFPFFVGQRLSVVWLFSRSCLAVHLLAFDTCLMQAWRRAH